MARGRNALGSNGKLPADRPKVKINKENIREALALFAYVKPYRSKFILSLGCIALSAFTTALFPLFLGKMIDAVSPGAGLPVPGGAASGLSAVLKNIHWSLNTTLLLIFLQLGVQTIFSYMRVYLLTEVGEKSLAGMRKDVYSKMLTMPMHFFGERRVGELSSRISSDLSQIQDAISFTLAEFLRGVFTLIIGLVFIFMISAKLAFVMLSIVPILAIVAVLFGKRIRKMSRKAQDQLAESSIIVQETFHGIAIVKAFTGEFHEITRYAKHIYAVVNTAITNARYRGAFVSFMILGLFGSIAFVIWYGAHLIPKELSVGLLISFVVFSGFVGGTFAGFADIFSQLQKTLGATQSIREILRAESEPIDTKPVVVEPQYALKGNVRFDNIHFSYPSRKDLPVLNGLSLSATDGQQVAIVGPSGAGKSTIASLLLRFYDPGNGILSFDERPAADYPLSQLRRQMAFVPQEVQLFGGSIKENIAYGRPGATDEEIMDAAVKAHAHEFIARFPEKYDTIVGERGIKLSGGQRQRIAIARAILKDPVILILDEATSSLDSESEQLVQDALENLMKGRTSFVIAHRLSTIRNADKIVVIDKGAVAETGTHQELMSHNGLYRKLNDMQFDFGVLNSGPNA